MKKERILLKLSGANLKQGCGDTFFSHETVKNLAEQVKFLSQKYSVCLVVGGGNIWRGRNNEMSDFLLDRDAHIVGMLSTMMNSVVVQNYLKALSVDSVIFSAISCTRIAEDLCSEKIDRSLNEGKVLIFAAGSGCPFFTTDTCAAVRALETGTKRIFVGKSGTDGIYDSDPNVNKDAKFLERIKYEEVINRDLSVMDLTAMCILRENGRPEIVVFDQAEQDAFIKACEGKIKCSIVY